MNPFAALVEKPRFHHVGVVSHVHHLDVEPIKPTKPLTRAEKHRARRMKVLEFIKAAKRTTREEIGASLRISRNTVTKDVGRLQREGYPVISRRRFGFEYGLGDPWELTPVQQDGLEAFIKVGTIGGSAELLGVTPRAFKQTKARTMKRMGMTNWVIAVIAYDRWKRGAVQH